MGYKIRYFDLGAHKGEEITFMLGTLPGIPGVDSVEVIGVEANPELFRVLSSTFQNDPRVKLFNFAIAAKNGKLALFPGRGSTLSSSIYDDKNNVVKESPILVPASPFSDWAKQNIPGFPVKNPDEINIVKLNIEGAEWDFIQNLNEHGIFWWFDLYLGDTSKEGDFSTDMRKIESLVPYVDLMREIVKGSGIKTLRFSCAIRDKTCTLDVAPAVAELIRRRAAGEDWIGTHNCPKKVWTEKSGTIRPILHPKALIRPGVILDTTAQITMGWSTLSWGCEVFTHQHFYHLDKTIHHHLNRGHFKLPLLIEDDVFVGERVMILPQVTKLPKGCLIGAGSVLSTTPTGEYQIWAGNPARFIRERGPKESGKVW